MRFEMTTKRNQIKQYIQSRGAGFRIDTFQLHDIVLTFDVSPSTIYAALRELRGIKALDADNVYTGRFVRPYELICAMFADDDLDLNYVLLTDAKRDELCAKLYTTPRLLYQALEWAAPYMIVDATFYGMSYRINRTTFSRLEKEQEQPMKQQTRVAACAAQEAPSISSEVVEEETPCTCQICGRAIKANSGVIAHHGYKRPEYGFQTASCSGARHLPYEQSCDAIQPAIDANRNAIERTEAAIAELKANPPAQLRCEKYAGAWKRPTIVMVDRPVFFNVENAMRSSTDRMYDYTSLFRDEINKREKAIKEWQAGIDYLQKRLDDWKAPGSETSDDLTEWIDPALDKALDALDTDETVLLSSLPSTYNPESNAEALAELDAGEAFENALTVAAERIDDLQQREAALSQSALDLLSAWDFYTSHSGDCNAYAEFSETVARLRSLFAIDEGEN